MLSKIGFTAEQNDTMLNDFSYVPSHDDTVIRKSIVQVHFPQRNMTLAYYNDRFALKSGDCVYVSGKLEGVRGQVTDINYNFKIKLSHYQRVIAVVDMAISGQLSMVGSHFVTFSRETLPKSKIIGWFKAPEDEEEFITGSDGTSFSLDDLNGMNIAGEIAERGYNYYLENKVRYICVDAGHGYAIVEGGEVYEVEFEYKNGDISNLVCSCYCCCNCKHEFAAILQLRETLELIKKNYAQEYERSGYFAAMNKAILFSFAVYGKETGSLTL